jgi:Zn finger protein HypA/HybF involved in hydrogenase expression
MALSLNCPNSYIDAAGKTKKCGTVYPYIDPKTDKVYCSVCNNELTNVSYFQKTTLKTLKQYKQKSTATFSVTCKSCGHEAQPILENGKVICPQCKKEHSHLTEQFKFMLKKCLKEANQDINLA